MVGSCRLSVAEAAPPSSFRPSSPSPALPNPRCHAVWPGCPCKGFPVTHRSSCRPSDCVHTHCGFVALYLASLRRLPSSVHLWGCGWHPMTSACQYCFLLGLVLDPSPLASRLILASSEQSSLLTIPQGFFKGPGLCSLGLLSPSCSSLLRLWGSG